MNQRLYPRKPSNGNSISGKATFEKSELKVNGKVVQSSSSITSSGDPEAQEVALQNLNKNMLKLDGQEENQSNEQLDATDDDSGDRLGKDTDPSEDDSLKSEGDGDSTGKPKTEDPNKDVNTSENQDDSQKGTNKETPPDRDSNSNDKNNNNNNVSNTTPSEKGKTTPPSSNQSSTNSGHQASKNSGSSQSSSLIHQPKDNSNNRNNGNSKNKGESSDSSLSSSTPTTVDKNGNSSSGLPIVPNNNNLEQGAPGTGNNISTGQTETYVGNDSGKMIGIASCSVFAVVCIFALIAMFVKRKRRPVISENGKKRKISILPISNSYHSSYQQGYYMEEPNYDNEDDTDSYYKQNPYRDSRKYSDGSEIISQITPTSQMYSVKTLPQVPGSPNYFLQKPAAMYPKPINHFPVKQQPAISIFSANPSFAAVHHGNQTLRPVDDKDFYTANRMENNYSPFRFTPEPQTEVDSNKQRNKTVRLSFKPSQLMQAIHEESQHNRDSMGSLCFSEVSSRPSSPI